MSIIEQIEELRQRFALKHPYPPTLVIMTPDHRSGLFQELVDLGLAQQYEAGAGSSDLPEYHGMRIVRSWDFEEPVVGVL